MSAVATIRPVAVSAIPAAREPADGVALKLFHQVPGWAIVHAARDNRNSPLIRKGEIAIVKSDGMNGVLPAEGGLFLIEYASIPMARYERCRRTRDIVQTIKNACGHWCATSIRRGMVDGELHTMDGPYREMDDLADKLIGRIVGIYAPSMIGGA
jgi:hypothetical protein